MGDKEEKERRINVINRKGKKVSVEDKEDNERKDEKNTEEKINIDQKATRWETRKRKRGE